MAETACQRTRRSAILDLAMDNPQVRRADIARKMGTSRAAVTQFFRRAGSVSPARRRVSRVLSLSSLNV